MKYFLGFALLFTCLGAQAQQPFEGRIDYILSSRDSTIKLLISSFYGDRKIYFEMKVLKKPAVGADVKDEKVLIDFASNNFDRIHDSTRHIQRESIAGPNAKHDLPPMKQSTDTTFILGKRAIAWSTGRISKEEMKDSVKMTASVGVSIWYSPDLLFPVPDSMATVQMIPLFTNGYIALGSSINIEAGPVKLLLNTRAIDIRPGKLGDNVFRLPEGYEIRRDD